MELAYQFRERMLTVHKPGRRMEFSKKADNEIEISGDWTIYIPSSDDAVIYNAARDLEDYFAKSMGICLRFQIGGEIPENSIVFEVKEKENYDEYLFSVASDRVLLQGSSPRAAMQAGFYMEDQMNIKEGPYLETGDTVRSPLYSPRMVHSGFGLDMFPEEHLINIAHAGINALLIFVCDVDVTPHGYQDFNSLIYRASKWGIDVYAYSYMLSKVYPEGKEAEDFYENLYGRLFKKCPGLKGVIFVGESCEFPSKDPHTTGILRLDNMDENGEYIIKDKPSPGWWPCYDYPLWLNMVKKIIRTHKPDADIVFWTYNWGYVNEKDRLELLRHIPTDVSLLVTYEMFEDVERMGLVSRTVDYSLFFEGPGKYFESEAKLAKERGIRLYAMTNTGGLTWDVGTIPYEPCPYQWKRRYDNMKKAHDDWGLCGIMDSHHYGIYPSFISDYAKAAFYSPVPDLDEYIRKLAVRDFSKETADKVLEAYMCFSDGVRTLISTNEDQYGPFRIGPAFPLLLPINKGTVFPGVPWAPHAGNEICNPLYPYDLSSESQMERIKGEIRCLENTISLYDKGCEILRECIPEIHKSKVKEAQYLENMCHFISNACRTTVNVKRWAIEREKLTGGTIDEKKTAIENMKKIAAEEIENAKNTLPLVDFDSRLGFEPTMDYMGGRDHIEWKIKVTEKVVSEDLEKYLTM